MDGEESKRDTADPAHSGISTPPEAAGHDQQHGANHSGQPSKKASPWHMRTVEWLAGFNEPITIVTLLLFFATLGLWVATKDLVYDAKESSEKQLRAYVGISTANPIALDRQRIVITIDNFGQTPAMHTKVYSNWAFVPYGRDLPVGFEFVEKPTCKSPDGQEIEPGNGIVWPKNPVPTTHLHCQDELASLLKAERKELNAFLYGRIEYLDIFGKERQTNFCGLYNPFLNATILCANHNEIDPYERH